MKGTLRLIEICNPYLARYLADAVLEQLRHVVSIAVQLLPDDVSQEPLLRDCWRSVIEKKSSTYDASALKSIADRFDEEYFELQASEGSEQEYDLLYRKARAAAGLAYVVGGITRTNVPEAIYEFAFASESEQAFFERVVKQISASDPK